jgi:hypothetical protein
MYRTLIPAALLVTAVACGTPTETAETGAPPTAAERCILDYPADTYGFGDGDPDAASLDCTAAGATDCDVAGFMSIEAARCVAEDAGLEPGLTDWSFGIWFYTDEGAVAWSVQNTLTQDGPSSSGRSLRIHATSGAVLSQLEWEAQP